MPENCKSTVRTTVRAKICFSNELPGGLPPLELPEGAMMMELELDDLTLLIIRRQPWTVTCTTSGTATSTGSPPSASGPAILPEPASSGLLAPQAC
jgi:hypothetical protein